MSKRKRADELPYRALGSRLRQLREQARLTQPDLAELIEMSRSYPSVWELGKSRPTPGVLRRAVRVLRDYGVAADYGELAALAGYADLPPEASVPVDDAAKVPLLRVLATLPVGVLHAVLDVGTRLQAAWPADDSAGGTAGDQSPGPAPGQEDDSID